MLGSAVTVISDLSCRRNPPASSKISSSAPVQASRDSSAEPRDAHRDSRTNKPSDRDTDRPTDRHTDRHTDRRSDRARGDYRDQETVNHEDIRARDRDESLTDRQQERARAAPRRPLVNPNSKQAELLAFAASDMNAFSNDGSFMEKFAAAQDSAAMQSSPVNKLSGNCCKGSSYSNNESNCDSVDE